ncbi:MAG: hypothetical protein ABFS56_24265, partial [Pseudomonadota bacterium]
RTLNFMALTRSVLQGEPEINAIKLSSKHSFVGWAKCFFCPPFRGWWATKNTLPTLQYSPKLKLWTPVLESKALALDRCWSPKL